MMYKKHVLAFVLAAASCSATRGAPLASSTFNTDSEGWSAISTPGPPAGAAPPIAYTYPVTYSATGGNPGGNISESDQDPDVYYFSAPSKFLGNQSLALDGTFEFDIDDSPNTTNLNANESPLILVGASESIYFPDVSTVTAAFSTLSFTLSAGHGGTINAQGGTAATNTDFAQVLGNLQKVYVLGDYWFEADTAVLDNVSLNAVPEPSALAVLVLGGAVGAACFLKRRRGQTAEAH